QAAVDEPRRIQSLTLMEPPLATFVPDGAQFGKKLENSLSLYQQGKKFESLDSFLKVVFEGTKDYRKIIDSQLGSKAFDNALSILDTMFQLEFPALLKWKFDPKNTKSMIMPILSVRGTDSSIFFQQIHLLLQSWFPHLETLVIPNCSHILHMQSPDLVANGLESFFSMHR
ncbi:MAG TPA: alpha/beta hydrolase, partial [Nitrososphaeraceae archaeon]